METLIYLLKFAADNEKYFTEFDPDGVKRAWIEEVKKALAAQQGVQPTLLTVCPKCGGWLKGGECENCTLP